MTEKLNIGMDFGTSNSSVASTTEGKTTIFNTRGKNKSQPSSIYIRADGYTSTGFDALVDFAKKDESETFHFIPSIKPALPLSYYDGISLKSKSKSETGRPNVHFFGVEELASIVISDLKQNAENQSGSKSESVVLGRPVFFSDNKEEDRLAQERLENAARLAGFRNINFVMEPIAAALYYEKTRKNTQAKNVFIFDFGGGTLDTCILELDKNKKAERTLESKVLSSHGIVLGGTNLDKDVFSKKYMSYFGQRALWSEKGLSMPTHIYYKLPEWHLQEIEYRNDTLHFLRQVANGSTDPDAIRRLHTLIEDQQVFALLQSVEKGKIGLTPSGKSRIEFEHKDIAINDTFTLREFESLISSRRSEINECIDVCLEKAGMKGDQIDAVLKVGGSSNNAFINGLLSKRFNRTIESDDVFTSVVAGLSIAAEEVFN